jgi:DNA polymerase III alpha subunit (gram-positive type)
MNFSERPIIITDFETTGLDSRTQDIIEIGAFKVDQKNLVVSGFFDTKVHIQHPNTISHEALAVNGYTKDSWGDAVFLPHAIQNFSKFAADGVLASWNITFEYDFLAEAFRRVGLANPMDYHRIDIPSIAWFKFSPINKISQDAIGALLGLPEEIKPHRALQGAHYALDILRKLRGFNV